VYRGIVRMGFRVSDAMFCERKHVARRRSALTFSFSLSYHILIDAHTSATKVSSCDSDWL
jgi:hypothetical protein